MALFGFLVPKISEKGREVPFFRLENAFLVPKISKKGHEVFGNSELGIFAVGETAEKLRTAEFLLVSCTQSDQPDGWRTLSSALADGGRQYSGLALSLGDRRLPSWSIVVTGN